MTAYINGLACISPYKTFEEDYFFEDAKRVISGNRLKAEDPVYSQFISPIVLRRMSRIIKMGVSTALMSVKDSANKKVDAIITGTGMACAEDTDTFLRSLLDSDEEMPLPTAFIRSTHNTVAGQIALQLKCTGYNCTYIHQNLAFEHALIDAMMLLEEKEARNILVGGIDEISPAIFEIFERGGHIKKHSENIPLWEAREKGYVMGEGAAFFSLSEEPLSHSSPRIIGVTCIHELQGEGDLLRQVNLFLSEKDISKDQISLVLSGNCGDPETDKPISAFNRSISLPVAYFKHLCGEYFSSSAFAVWLGANILMKQQVPPVIFPEPAVIPALEKILIVNHYQNKQYSLILIGK
jgi:3-oxoacyl-[acyl-carrier-protein] synthase II